MLTLYGEFKTDGEIRLFVMDYVKKVKETVEDRFHAIMSLIPSGGNVLDYGCGWGHYSIAIRDKGNIVTAIDYSQNEIDICSVVWGKQDSIEFVNKPISSFDNESFSCVLSNQVIEHVHNVGNYLSQINRVLKGDGLLIISLPNIMNPRFLFGMLHSGMEEKLIRLSEECIDGYEKSQDHINAWDPAHFTRLLASVGFKLERYVPTEGVAMPFRKPFKPCWYTNLNRIKNLSYTMTFCFRKCKNITVDNEA